VDFGEALEQLKEGKKLARHGWNGYHKDMWICLMPALYLESEKVNGRTKEHIGEGIDLDCQPYIALWTAKNKWQPGWLASQEDMLADDWEIVE